MGAARPELRPGATLGRYVIDAKVGQGGMGVVWRARQIGAHAFERTVALKTLHPAFDDEGARAMLLDEARIAAAVVHPNVVQVLDVADEAGVLFLVLEWVPGRTLAQLHAEAKKKGDGKNPRLNLDGTVDMVLIMRGLHGMKNGNTLTTWLEETHKALKNGGTLSIEEHRSLPDADPAVSAKKGYLPEKWVIETIEAAGFKLAGKSEVNANPKDTKDYPEGVWTLPPTLRLGDTDKDKYVAIGESDRMTLKFTKVAKKADKPAPKK